MPRARTQGNWFSRALKKLSLGILVCVILVLGASMIARFARRAPAHEKISVEILNGCGIQGMGARTRTLLRDKEFDVVDVSNADRFDYLGTIALDRTGEISNAREIIKALGTGEAITQVVDNSLAEVTLILGADAPGALPASAR